MAGDRGPVSELAAENVECGQCDCDILGRFESVQRTVFRRHTAEILSVIVGSVLFFIDRNRTQIRFHRRSVRLVFGAGIMRYRHSGEGADDDNDYKYFD